MRNKTFDHRGRAFEIRVTFENGEFVVRLFEDDQQASDLVYTVGHETAVDAGTTEVSPDLVDHLVELMMSDVTSGRLRLRKTNIQERKAALKKSLEIHPFRLIFKTVGNAQHEKEMMGSFDEAMTAACEMLQDGTARSVDLKEDGNDSFCIFHSDIVEWCKRRMLTKK